MSKKELIFGKEGKIVDLIEVAKKSCFESKDVKVKAIVVFLETEEYDSQYALVADGYEWRKKVLEG